MRGLVIYSLLLFLFLQCRTEDDCGRFCNDFERHTCDSSDEETKAIISAFIDHYSVGLMFVQQSPTKQAPIVVNNLGGNCDTLFDDSLLNGLSSLVTEESSWCVEVFDVRPVVSIEELNCFHSDNNADIECLTRRNNSHKFIELSQPYIEGEEAVIYFIDSGCSEELAYLKKVAGEWRVLCTTTLTTC